MDETHYTIRIPKLEGYKTLIVNAALIVLGVVALFRPHWVLPNADSLGLAYDHLTGIIMAVISGVNILLRLMTTRPVPDAVNVLGTTPPKPDLDNPAVELARRRAYEIGKQRGIASEREAQSVLQSQDPRLLGSLTERLAAVTPELDPQDLAAAYANDARHLTYEAARQYADQCQQEDAQQHEDAHEVHAEPPTPIKAAVALTAFLTPSVLLCVGEAGRAMARALT